MTPYRAHSTPRHSQSREPSALARGAWATIKLVGLLAVVGVAGWFIFQQQFRSRLSSVLQEQFDTALAGSGVMAAIGEARFFDGQGMLLTNVNVSMPNVSLTAYETFVSMPVNTPELVSGRTKVDAIEMRRVQLEIVRPAEGVFDWSGLSQLIESLQNTPRDTPAQLLPVALIDSQIKFVDQKLGIEKTVSDINLHLSPVTHEGRKILEVGISAAAVDVRQFEIKGFVDPDSGEWNAELHLNGAVIDRQLLAVLPRMPTAFEGLQSLGGRVNGMLYAHGNWNTDLVRWFEGSGSFGAVLLQHEELPFPVHHTSGTWSFSPDGLRVSNIAGQFGRAKFLAKAQTGRLGSPLAWRVNGRLESFELDNSEFAIQAMPQKTHRFLNDFRPRGIFDVDFDFHSDGREFHKSIETKISDLAVNFVRFPYPLTDCRCSARWVDDELSYQIVQQSEHRTLSVKGVVLNPGNEAVWRCDLNVDKGVLPFDEKLQAAMDVNPDFARVVRAFHAYGGLTGSGRLERLVPGGEVDKRFNINLRDITMRHDGFPYTIESVSGNIQTVNHAFTFNEFSGHNGSGKIACAGSWNPNDGLKVRYQCDDIPLDGRLRQALRPELQDVWDGFRPEGTVESMTVDMTLAPRSKECQVVVDAKLHGEENGIRTSNLTINPTWFPYKLSNLAGKLVVGHGKVMLREFQGQHDRTKVVCDGDGSYSNEGWDVRLSNLLALSLKADGPLLRALPESLATPIEFMKFKGLLNVHGTVTLAGQYRKPSVQYASNIRNEFRLPSTTGTFANGTPATAAQIQQVAASELASTPRVSMGWDARFDMNQAEMFLGIPVENVFGMFELIGQFDGEQVECRGSVDLDSLTVYGGQITQVRGPVWFDNYQALAGGLINQVSRSGSASPSITGKMYGGVVRLDAAISSDEQGRFLIQTTLADGSLKQLGEDFAPGVEDIEGHTFAALRMQGDASGSHTWRGSGQIHVRDAKIYELPPAARLLKLFQVRRINDVAFDSGDLFFAVNGENIDINRMEFNGDAISIIGNGQMSMEHDLDLNFYSVVGRHQINIPVISDLYRRSSQKFMWINVGGTCQEPKITREVLPELNESLRQLFQLEVH